MAGSLYQGKYFVIFHVVVIAFAKPRYSLRDCFYLSGRNLSLDPMSYLSPCTQVLV